MLRRKQYDRIIKNKIAAKRHIYMFPFDFVSAVFVKFEWLYVISALFHELKQNILKFV